MRDLHRSGKTKILSGKHAIITKNCTGNYFTLAHEWVFSPLRATGLHCGHSACLHKLQKTMIRPQLSTSKDLPSQQCYDLNRRLASN